MAIRHFDLRNIFYPRNSTNVVRTCHVTYLRDFIGLQKSCSGYKSTYTKYTRPSACAVGSGSARLARVRMASKGVILPGYKDTLTDLRSKERYQEKLKLLNGIDPYELPREAWKDDVDIWPCITYIHVGMYILGVLSECLYR